MRRLTGRGIGTPVDRTVGIVKPSNRPVRDDDLLRPLPPGVRLRHRSVGVANGGADELRAAIDTYDKPVRALAAATDVAMINAAGAPLLPLGHAAERAMLARWERDGGKPVFSSATSQAHALRALQCRRLVGLSYLPGAINASFARYWTDTGFVVLDMVEPRHAVRRVPIGAAGTARRFHPSSSPNAPRRGRDLPARSCVAYVSLVMPLDGELGMPIVHHVPAQSFEIWRLLGVRHPVQGFGRLMAELPGLG